jgi:hypothetical protein
MPESMDTLGMFRLVADKLEKNPALLQVGLENIARWLGQGTDARARLEEWRERIVAAGQTEAGMQSLLRLLREESEQADYLRNFAPFAGVLSTAERRRFIEQCAFTH